MTWISRSCRYRPGYVGNNGELPTSDNNGGTTEAHRLGCLYDPHLDLPVLSTTTQNGGNDWSGPSFVQKRGMYITPYAYANVAHYRSEGSNGLRAPGEYQSGRRPGNERHDRSSPVGTEMARPRPGARAEPLATASDLVFLGQADGYFVAMDVLTGKILWKFQSGAGVEGGMATYSIDGEQYVVALSFVRRRLRDGVQARRHDGRASRAGVVGRSHPATVRRHADAWHHGPTSGAGT